MLGGPKARVEVFARPSFCGMKSVSQALGALPATSKAVGGKNAHNTSLTNFMSRLNIMSANIKEWAFDFHFNGVGVPGLLTEDWGHQFRPAIVCLPLDCGRHQGLKDGKQDASVRTWFRTSNVALVEVVCYLMARERSMIGSVSSLLSSQIGRSTVVCWAHRMMCVHDVEE